MLYCEDAFSHTKYESASYYESPYRKVVETIDSCPESVQKAPPKKCSEAEISRAKLAFSGADTNY